MILRTTLAEKDAMDKRKVNGGGPSEELDDRAAKRRKMPNGVSYLAPSSHQFCDAQVNECAVWIGFVYR